MVTAQEVVITMPDGVVQWFDLDSGEGRVLHAGKRYVVKAADADPAARVAGARVHFDVEREFYAVDVQPRAGRRTTRRQRRFGDLTGSPVSDAKGDAPFASPQPELGRDLQRHPVQVVEQWARSLGDGDLEQAMQLYAPNAALHAGGRVLIGTRAIRGYWEISPLLGRASDPEITGTDGEFEVWWTSGADTATPVIRLRVAHGEIAEQHVADVRSVEAAPEPAPASLEVSTSGPVPDRDVAHAVDKVGKVVDTFGDTVLHTDLRLALAADPARERPAMVRAIVDVDGEPIRAQVSAALMSEAIDLLEDRLRRRFEQLSAYRQTLRRRGTESGEGQWRHGDLPSHRPDHHPRPTDEREIVRHKSFEPDETTLDEAVFDLEAMDFDFCLFHDLASGQDAVVHRAEGGTYVVRYVHGPDPSATEVPSAATVHVDTRRAAVLTVDEARERLEAGQERWVFFEDAITRRGHVLYLRYDGHYGLIVPIDEPDGVDVPPGGELART